MRKHTERLAAALIAALSLSCGAPRALADSQPASVAPAAEDDYEYFAESVGSRESWPTSSAWGLAFRQTLAPHLAWSMAYLNDGHFPGHHRDGVTGEVWLPFTFADEHLTASIGGGTFYYFDTEHAGNPSGYADVHGWAWILSADLRIHLFSRASEPGWYIDLRYDWSAPAKDIETHSIGAGLGYRMYSDYAAHSPNQGSPEGFASYEVVGYLGKTVVNSFSSQTSLAEAGEFRTGLFSSVARFSVAFVNEGDAQLIRRNGFIYELWAEPSFWDGNASVGIGWGGYTAVDKYQPSPGRHVSYVVSTTLSARLLNLVPGLRATDIGQRLAFRVTWHRIVSDYNRDTDILLFGLGYRF